MTRSVANLTNAILIPEQLLWPRPHLQDAPEFFVPANLIAGGVTRLQAALLLALAYNLAQVFRHPFSEPEDTTVGMFPGT
jgi:hypothetical protein